MDKQKIITILGVVCLWLLLANGAFADVPTDNSLDDFKNVYRDTAANWSPVLVGYATNIFWILAVIDVVVMAIWLILNPGDFSDFTTNLIRKVLFIGLFWAFLQPVGGVARGITWADAIVCSLVRAGGDANAAVGGTANITPVEIFDTGFSLCAQVLDAVSVWDPADSLALVIGAFIIMICFSLIAAMMLLMYVQSYIIVYGGVILLGFGGSVFTKDIALKYFQAALTVGVRLFVMILVVGLGQIILQQWLPLQDVTLKQISLFIGASIVLLALVKAIPDLVGDLINGFSWGSGESLIRSTSQIGKGAFGTAVGAAAGAVGGTMAVAEASKMSGATGAGGFASRVGSTVSNLGKAAMQDTGQRLAGVHQGQGTKGGRMASILKAGRLAGDVGQAKEEKDEPYISPAVDVTKKE